jgi:hypothetical protein
MSGAFPGALPKASKSEPPSKRGAALPSQGRGPARVPRRRVGKPKQNRRPAILSRPTPFAPDAMIPKALSQLAFTLIAATSLAGCFEPIQSGGVMIIGDPSERVGALCRFRRKDLATDSFCSPDAPAAAQNGARVRRMASAAEGLQGPHASGGAGDYLLENDEIAVVVSQPSSRRAPFESGGHIVDAGSAKDRVDSLESMATALGSPQKHPAYDAIFSGVERDGSAWVEVRGHEAGGDGAHATLRIQTRYTLAAGARAVAVKTTAESTDAAGPGALDLGDVVCWGGARAAAPGASLPQGEVTETNAPYVLGAGGGAAYAIAADGRPFFAVHDASCSRVAFTRGAAVAPLAATSYERMLVVAPRGDTAAVASELFFLAGGTPGSIEIGVAWGAIPSPRRAGSRIALRRLSEPGAAPAAFPDPPELWLALPPAGSPATDLPPGRYSARLEGPGVTSPETVVVVEQDRVARLDLVASLFDGESQIPQKE